MPQHVPPVAPSVTSLVPRQTTEAATAAPAVQAPPTPRRIVFLARRDLDNPAAGGSELLIDRIAQGLVAHGHQVTLVCGGPAAYRDYRVVSAGGDADHFLRAKRALNRQVGDCDLLVEVSNGLPYLAPLWHRGPTMCLVNHVHTELWGMRYPAPAARLGRKLEHWALAGTHKENLLVAVSGSTAGALRDLGVPGERIRIVHNGVERPAALLPKSPEPLFVAVGRLVEYKRVDLLLRLWERVRPVTGGRLVIIGDGPERANLEAAAGPDVTFTGHVSEAEKHRLLCEAWLLLHPSAMEGWGLVVMEAAARGTPAVGFDIPGLRDSIVDGSTGLLARGESSFAAAWCSLALSNQRRELMGSAAARRAESFGWEHTVRAFRSVAAEAYRRATAGRGVASVGTRPARHPAGR
ncbi:glycosyltransferase family 4 protein [Streptomyces alkaliterrae]|uniref:Glycosyltransferase n=1 Tax=Streptomyces alkaliterrae TaxID=2213162 RepID=A0A5P0YNH4_9ACTN|nr:glycosyltransferase family 4 protein [Streptomyces alkaliterrae]MBB1253736.1 glycosyltransferase family 4 protein [Streptomyces alkaliterrae]MBB1260245.1 glycosyltransferase family 4 protein [Streptomyces alkaliterrae]MQS01903.1 glycosyltransferase [Streptomyces alkaliterrae]